MNDKYIIKYNLKKSSKKFKKSKKSKQAFVILSRACGKTGKSVCVSGAF